MHQQPITEFQLLLKALGYVRTHWWLLVLEICVTYGFSLNTYYQTEPEYESSASILIDNSRRQLYQSYMLSSQSTSMARKQNMAHLLTSQEVMERFRNQLTEFYNQEGRPLHLRPYFPSGTALPASTFRKHVFLSWDKNSDIYSLQCLAPNPDAAHDLCLNYMNTVQVYYPEIGQREAMMKREFLARQISSIARQIAEKETVFSEIQRKSPEFLDFMIMDVEGQGRSKIQKELNLLRDRIETNRATKKLLIHVPQARKGEHTVLQTTITELTNRLSDLKYQKELLEKSNDPNRIQRGANLNQEIERVTAQVSKLNDMEVSSYMKNPFNSGDVRKKVTDLELEYQVTLLRISSLNRQLEDLHTREKKFNQQKLEYDRVKTEMYHKKRLLTSLLSKEQETELEISAGSAEIYRLQEPVRNNIRIAPHLTKYLYGSLSVSLFVLAVTIVVLMAFFPRLDSEAEVNRLNLPVIGKVPFMKRNSEGFDEIPTYGMEHLKIMNYRILRETKDIKCPIIVVTSPHAREGKSTVTHSLSLAAQSPNRKCLLIDGDLLTSRPNRFFGIQEDQTLGLHSLVMHPNPPHYNDVIVRTVNEGISLLPRGERIEPGQLTSFVKPMEHLLADLRKEYDLIMVDTPPLFASTLSHQWAGFADLIVVVARLFVTRPKDIVEAIQTCKVFSKSPVGISLNCVPLSGPYRRASNYYFSRKKSKVSRIAA